MKKFMIVLGCCCFFAGCDEWTNANPDESSDVKPEIQNQKREEEKENSAWLTYENKAFGIRFKYPSFLEVINKDEHIILKEKNEDEFSAYFIETIIKKSSRPFMGYDGVEINTENKNRIKKVEYISMSESPFHILENHKNKEIFEFKPDRENPLLFSDKAEMYYEILLEIIDSVEFLENDEKAEIIKKSAWETYENKVLGIRFQYLNDRKISENKELSGFDTGKIREIRMSNLDLCETKGIDCSDFMSLSFHFVSSDFGQGIIEGRPIGFINKGQPPLDLTLSDQVLKETLIDAYENIYELERINLGDKEGVRFFTLNYYGQAGIVEKIIIPLEPENFSNLVITKYFGQSSFFGDQTSDWKSYLPEIESAIREKSFIHKNETTKAEYEQMNKILESVEFFEYKNHKTVKNVVLPEGDIGCRMVRKADGIYTDGNEQTKLKAIKDPQTFGFLSENCTYAKDTEAVYWINPAINTHIEILDLSPKTTHLIEGDYVTDDKKVYFETYEIVDADPQSFEVLDYERITNTVKRAYAKDKNAVYKRHLKINNADSQTFRILSNGYTRDDDFIFYDAKQVPEADPDSFEFIEILGHNRLRYAKDKTYVYLDETIIPEADPQTFDLIKNDYVWRPSTVYTKDDHHVFWGHKKVEGVDTDSFEIISGNKRGEWLGQDQFHIFKDGKILEGADPATFKVP